MARYQMKTVLPGRFDAVKARVVEALRAEGFGVLTEIDVQQTLRAKVGAALEPYQILGACSPQLAHRALAADRALGLLLPCNVVLRGLDDAVEVGILDPEVMFEVADPATRAALTTLPAEARARLARALASLTRED